MAGVGLRGVVIGSSFSQPSRSAMHVARLLSPLPIEWRDLAKGEAYSEEYQKKNPNRKFPVLITSTASDNTDDSNSNDNYAANASTSTTSNAKAATAADDFVLYESTAIARFLCNEAATGRYGPTAQAVAEQLYPSTPTVRGKIDQFLDWHHTNLRVGAAGQVCRHMMLLLLLLLLLLFTGFDQYW